MEAVGDEATERSRGVRAWPSSSRDEGRSGAREAVLRVWTGEAMAPLPWSFTVPPAAAVVVRPGREAEGKPGVLDPDAATGGFADARLLSVGSWPGPAETVPDGFALVMLRDEGKARASPGGRFATPGVCEPALGVTAPEPKGWCLSLSAFVLGGGMGPPRLAARSEMMLRGVVMPSFPPAIAPGVRVPEPSGMLAAGASAVPLLVLVLKLVRRLLGAADAASASGWPSRGEVEKTEAAEGSASVAARP